MLDQKCVWSLNSWDRCERQPLFFGSFSRPRSIVCLFNHQIPFWRSWALKFMPAALYSSVSSIRFGSRRWTTLALNVAPSIRDTGRQHIFELLPQILNTLGIYARFWLIALSYLTQTDPTGRLTEFQLAEIKKAFAICDQVRSFGPFKQVSLHFCICCRAESHLLNFGILACRMETAPLMPMNWE